MSYRDDLLARVDALAFFGRLGIETKRLNDSEYRFNCPFHDDRNASANVNINDKTWYCHAENVGDSLIGFLMKARNLTYKDAAGQLEEWFGGATVGGTAAPARSRGNHNLARLTEANVLKWHQAALGNTDLMTWFHDHRGFTDETVARWQLGWDGDRVTIPIRDADGHLANVRRYKRNATEGDKMMPLVSGTDAATRLFPVGALATDEILLCEGEWDAMLLWQQGFENALTVTSGAGIFKPEWVPLFEHKKVALLFDNDAAGAKGAQRVAKMLSSVAEVSIVTVPGLPEKGDVTDFFVGGRAADELAMLIRDAAPFIVAVTEPEEGEPTKVPLAFASEARYRGKRLRVPVLLSGKAMTPYTVPYKFDVHCDMSNRRLCSMCPMAATVGRVTITLSAKDPNVLQLIAVTNQQQYTAIKALAKAVPQCNRPQVEIAESANIEELRVIPELDTSNEAGESEYVSRTAYFLGHGLRSNRSYEVIGYTHPLPKSQATVHLVSEAVPSQDNISAFALTDEIKQGLEIFRMDGSVEDKLKDVYADMQRNVHRIAGRLPMQIAFDLAWHSVISFYFNGAFVRRGWTEVMVLGDSGQGKTEMAMGLLGHYRLGERVQGEQASGAGLIGGLEKMNDTWILGWGRVPLNDKRLLIIDETQGLQSGQIESMSDVRATGVAEITKIRTERTNARCRLIWLANPTSGRPLSQYNQGILAMKDVFKKPEDIRRLDLVLGVASGDVSLTEINARHESSGTPKYSADACRNLVLWAWSRRPDQVAFEPEAAAAILAAATAMGRKYHPSLPVVEPADQRLKIARLAVALAARVFSTDATGEQLVVRSEHVDFIADYLDGIYSSRALAYDEYSAQMKAGESLSEDEASTVNAAMLDWPSAAEAVEFLRQAKVFRKTELEEVVGWDSNTAKDYIKYLVGKRLIRSTRDGYLKTPAFIGLLRELRDLPENRVAKAAEQVRAEMGADPFDD